MGIKVRKGSQWLTVSGGGGEAVGTVFMWSGASSNIPDGYLLCDGASVSRSTFAALFTAIGTVNGSVDSSSFNLPNLVNKFVVGASDSTGDTTYPGVSPGATGGNADATVVVQHAHNLPKITLNPGNDSTVAITLGSGQSYQIGYSNSSTLSSITTGNNSTGSATNGNLPPYYALCYIIKVFNTSAPLTGTNNKIFQSNTSAEVNDTGTDGYFKVSTEGSERFRITSDGKLGVGNFSSTTVEHLLDIQGSGGNFTKLALSNQNMNSSKYEIIFGDLGQVNHLVKANREFTIGTNDNERLRITSDGDTELRNIVSGINDSYSQYLKFRTTQTNGQSTVTGQIAGQGKTGWGGDLVFFTKPANSTPNDALTERLRIENNGTLNIGGNTSSNPFTYLRFGASQYGAADIRPTDEGSHKVGLAFYVDGSQDTTINPGEKFRINSYGAIGLNGANYGTTGKVLTSNGASSAPTWETASGGGSSPTPAVVASDLTTHTVENNSFSTFKTVNITPSTSGTSLLVVVNGRAFSAEDVDNSVKNVQVKLMRSSTQIGGTFTSTTGGVMLNIVSKDNPSHGGSQVTYTLQARTTGGGDDHPQFQASIFVFEIV